MRKWMMTLAAAASLTAAQPAAADTVFDYWEFANRISNAAGVQTGMGTPENSRAVSRVALAMFEAVNAIDRRYQSYLNFPEADGTAAQDAAAATAAYKVLLQHFPAQRSQIEESYALTMQGLGTSPAVAAGRAIGEQAAAAAMTAGGPDPAQTPEPYRPRTTPGEWIATGLPQIEPWMLTMRPWVIPSAEALLPPPPPALTSAAWARDYEEVRRLGGRTSSERTPYQTLVARYRQAFDVTPTMRTVAETAGRTPVQNARLFAVYQMAFDDAALAMVVAKFRYNTWRPITAIRNGAADGNDATQPDPAWVPLLPTPNFPEYPCGHCTVSGTIAEVMTAETGPRPRGGVRVSSLAAPLSAVQVLPSWDAWADEVNDSRMYGGVHYRFSNDAGEEIGRRAARMVLERAMQPLPRQRR
jgi:hypothetical protein